VWNFRGHASIFLGEYKVNSGHGDAGATEQVADTAIEGEQGVVHPRSLPRFWLGGLADWVQPSAPYSHLSHFTA
jgi:hypothetical protein